MAQAMKQQVSMDKKQTGTVFGILFAISAGHFINDSVQAIVPAMFPILQQSLSLTYIQIGWIAFVLNMTSSVMQPLFGLFADKRPMPFLLPFCMILSTIGIIGFALSAHFLLILFSVLFIGLGSAVFHPEGSRVAYTAAGNRRGLAQSIYQVGGNTGQSMAPIFTAFIFVRLGQIGALWFTVATTFGLVLLIYVSRWYSGQITILRTKAQDVAKAKPKKSISKQIKIAVALLIFFVFARSWYHAGISNFYQFYLIGDYGLSIKQAQIYLFIFMFAGVLGTFLGGPLADRFGRRNMIALSLLGAAPLAIALPYVPLALVIPMFFLIGFIVMSSFSVTVVYAQELLPNKIGMVSGLIVGLAFGLGAIGSILFGTLADLFSIKIVMIFCSFLPLLGLITFLMPTDEKVRQLNEGN